MDWIGLVLPSRSPFRHSHPPYFLFQPPPVLFALHYPLQACLFSYVLLRFCIGLIIIKSNLHSYQYQSKIKTS